MKRDIFFTMQNESESKDICVSIDIRVNELKSIMINKYKIDNKVKLFSENHQKFLDENSTLYDEKIWDGDILKVVR